MSMLWKRLARQWRDAINLVLGIWILFSPWALGFLADQAAAWNAYAVGAIVAVAAAAALVDFHKWEEWVNVALGAWLIVSPWILGVAAITPLVWNQVVVGLIVAGLAVWSAFAGQESGRLAKQS